MAAGVRLYSWWGLAMLLCLMTVYLDCGVGVPLRGDEGHTMGRIELLEEASGSILEQLAAAEREGSGEAAYDAAEGGPQLLQEVDLSTRSPQVDQVNTAVAKAAQVDLFDGLESDTKQTGRGSNDMFGQALEKWDAEKTTISHDTILQDDLLTADLSNKLESSQEKQTLESWGNTPPTPSVDESQRKTLTSRTTNDPLAAFQQEFSSSVADLPQSHIRRPGISPDETSESHDFLFDDVKPQVEQKTVVSQASDRKQGWMTNALAAWGQEQDSQIDDLGESDDLSESDDLGESDDATAQYGQDDLDLGETDDVDSTAAAAEKNLGEEIEVEAQNAASEVVKSTMKAVTRDFLFAEKAITRKISKNSPQLTLKDLEKAGGKSKQDKMKAKAKEVLKDMLLKAHSNYEMALANVHKNMKVELENTLLGLKTKLKATVQSIRSKSSLQQQSAKEEMEKTIRMKTSQIVLKVKAQLPGKLKAIKMSAEQSARKVAAMSIEQITEGAKTVRMHLVQDLGEAAGRVRAAEKHLASSDSNPGLALKAAVDVRTRKAKYHKLHDLAESALVQQKAKASKDIVKAQTNAEESVRLAVKDAEEKELKEARETLSTQQKKAEEEEQKNLEKKITQIKQMTEMKISNERKKFKKMVEAAVKLSPSKGAALRKKAKFGLLKAEKAAEAYAGQMIRSVAPHTVDGKTITKDMAADCVKNPTGCNLFTLKGQNTAAAAKFADSKARKAKRFQTEAKKKVHRALQQLRLATDMSNKYAKEAQSLDDKETNIQLAKLQLHQAQAAAAFHSAAKAHLKIQVVQKKLRREDDHVDSKLNQFTNALNEMKVTYDQSTLDEGEKAKAEKYAVFQKARETAKALLKLDAPK